MVRPDKSPYDAAGTKLYQTVVDGTNPEKRTDYIAGMVYENDALQFMQHEEGRVIPPGLVPGSQPTTNYEYQYHPSIVLVCNEDD